MTRHLLFGLALISAPAMAQTTTDAARADGKAFGAAKAPIAQSAATTAPTADRVPNFGGTPSQSAYFSNPDMMAREAASQATPNGGYQIGRASCRERVYVLV